MTMHDQSPLSLLGQNAGTPAISDLMRLALARPELISLAAGFVDQQSLPTPKQPVKPCNMAQRKAIPFFDML
jgi:hypothetical protein